MTLEDRYRRRLRAFPQRWRADHEEELIGVLLDAAAPNQESVPFADSFDLLTGAAKAWARSARGMISTRGVAVIVAGCLVVAGAVLGIVQVGGQISPEFLATSLIVVLVPGTGVVYTVSSSLGGGWHRGAIAAIGCTLGIVPHMLAAMIGLSGAMQAGATVFEVVRWIGVGYLAFMGLSMLRDGGALQLGGQEEARDQRRAEVIRRGILLNLLNPKLTLFFFAFLPQFLDTTPRLFDPRLVLLGLVFMAMTLTVFVGYAYVSSMVRDRVLDSPSMLRWVQRVLGSLLVGFAARLAVADR